MRKVFLIGSITMLMTGCVAPFPPLPGYDVAGGGTPQGYYDDGPYYGNRPYYGGPYYGNRPYYGGRYYGNRPYYGGRYYGNRPYYGGPYYGNRPYYVNRPYYSGRRSYYRSNPYSGRNYYRDEDDRDRNHHDKDSKDKKDKKHKKHHDGDKSVTTAIRSITTTIRVAACAFHRQARPERLYAAWPNIVVFHHRIRIHFIQAPRAAFSTMCGKVMASRPP